MHVCMCVISYMQVHRHICIQGMEAWNHVEWVLLFSPFYALKNELACLLALVAMLIWPIHVSTPCTRRLQTGHHMYFEGGESENWNSNPHTWATSTIPSEIFLQPSGFIFNCTLYLFEIYCDIIYEVINFLSLKLPSHQHLLNNPSSL